MRIGTIGLPEGAALAPMAGVTDATMRLDVRSGGLRVVGERNAVGQGLPVFPGQLRAPG